MLFDSTYLVMLYLVTQCYFWLLSGSVFKLSVICASGSCVELCRAVLSVLCELYLRCHKFLLSDLSKWYQAVVLDNWQDPLHLEVPPRHKLPRHKLQRHRLQDSSSQRAEYTVSRHGARTSSPRGGITFNSSQLSPPRPTGQPQS